MIEGNSGHGLNTLPLLQYVFKWARQANVTQPLTSGKTESPSYLKKT